MGNKCLQDTIQWYTLGHTTNKFMIAKGLKLDVYYVYRVLELCITL